LRPRPAQHRLAQGQATASVHFALGVEAWSRGDVVANNLAWLLTRGNSPDLNRALTLSEAAISQRPNDPRFRSTRGMILVKLGRWKEAIPDLERALATDGNNPNTHQALAEAYANLGQEDLATLHARLAKPSKVAAPATPH
jgi:predicted Zn-dependent protease